MFIFPQHAKDILGELIEAENQHVKMSLAEAMEKWGKGSTWEDLVDSGYISRMPDSVTATPDGKKWHAEN